MVHKKSFKKINFVEKIKINWPIIQAEYLMALNAERPKFIKKIYL